MDAGIINRLVAAASLTELRIPPWTLPMRSAYTSVLGKDARTHLLVLALRCPSVNSQQPSAVFASGGRGNFDLVLTLFCALLLISNIAATKLIAVGPLIMDGGAFLFPLTYVLGDVLAEVYGLQRTRRAIWTGFGTAAVMSLTLMVVNAVPAAPAWDLDAEWQAVLGFVPRIVIASLLGYLAGQFLNAWVLVELKKKTRERKLWMRLITSSVVGEFADTTVFCLVAFGPLGVWLGGGSLGALDLLNYVLVGWLYKTVVEVAFLPITYRVIATVKRHEPDYEIKIAE